MLQRLMLPRSSYKGLKEYAEGMDLQFIVTPFDIASGKFLADLGVQIMKIPSGEITNLPFLREVAALKIATILSTGMSELSEIDDAVAPFIQEKTPFALLHCVSAYPAPPEEINLRVMETMRKRYGVPVGFSDHTTGIEVPLIAVAAGAQFIEKHFTERKTDTGPDHAASLNPDELQRMISAIRNIEQDSESLHSFVHDETFIKHVLGSPEKHCQSSEKNTRDVARRSLILARNAKEGETLTEAAIAIKRPGTGLPPAMLPRLLGKSFRRNLDAGTLLTQDDLI